MKDINVLDLFCGCGGMSYGLSKAGFKIIAGIDNWTISLKTFELNHPNSKIINADILNCNPNDIRIKSNIDLIIGGPPCQGFSIAGKREIYDARNILYKGFINFVKYFKPKGFILENVPNLVSLGKGQIKNFILNDFENLGYKINYKVLKASDFGVPQNRKRVFFVGLRNDIFQFPEQEYGNNKPYISSFDAISDLPEYSLDNGSDYLIKPQSEYQEQMRIHSKSIYNHQTTKHTEKTIEIINLVPDGGNYKNLPENLQNIRKVHIAWTRLNSKLPSFTVDTGHRHHFHFKYNRIPTVRENARLQSFPDNFVFLGNKAEQEKQVGNAVPPLLIHKIGIKLKKYLI